MKIEANDLQSALIEASKKLQCSVVDLKYEIIQHPRKGFLGFGMKKAIIELKTKKRMIRKNFTVFENNKLDKQNKNFEEKNEKDIKYRLKNYGTFIKSQEKDQDILDEISIKLVKLLKSLDFKIELSELKMYSLNCIFIRLDGEDAALMIGKEAHRYKALSYLLHSWINLKYNLLVRLEIAQFLENQIQNMQFYLQTVIEKVKVNGRGQTKPLDGVLIKIALEHLRMQFPDKYVGIKKNNDQRFVIINDFLKKDE